MQDSESLNIFSGTESSLAFLSGFWTFADTAPLQRKPWASTSLDSGR